MWTSGVKAVKGSSYMQIKHVLVQSSLDFSASFHIPLDIDYTYLVLQFYFFPLRILLDQHMYFCFLQRKCKFPFK